LISKQTKKIKERLQELKKNAGTYVLIWFGGCFHSNDNERCINNIKTIFNKNNLTGIRVFVLDLTQIAQFCSQHLAIRYNYFNSSIGLCSNLDDWKSRFIDAPSNKEQKIEYFPETDNMKIIQQSMLATPYKPVQLLSHTPDEFKKNRLLVYESLKMERCYPITICVDAETFGPPLSTNLESNELGLNQIIVIDNCEKKHHRHIIDVLGQRTSRLGVIVLSTDGNPINDERFYLISRRRTYDSNFLKEIIKQNQKPLFLYRIIFTIPSLIKKN